MAGVSWLHYSLTKAAPEPPLKWQVGELNSSLIYKKPVLGTPHSGRIFRSSPIHLDTLSCHQFSQTWHPHHPLAPAPLRHPWTKWTAHRRDVSCMSASVFIGKHFLRAKVGVNTIRVKKPTALWQHSPGIAPSLYHNFSWHLHRFHYLSYISQAE